MFTGLIEDVGRIVGRERSGDDSSLTIRSQLAKSMAIGDSLAVNGVCLTVERKEDGDLLVFHTLAQTLRLSNLGQVPIDGPVNLERALAVGDRMGGHFVTGHVDGVAEVLAVLPEGDDHRIQVALPQAFAGLVVDKGCIAIDGISLTIASLSEDHLVVHIIPHTLAHTNLHAAQAGTVVNLEFDMIAKHVQRLATLGKL